MAENDEMIWVAGHNGSAGMGFHVTKKVKDYVDSHGLDYVYNRKEIQKQLDEIQARLDSEG